MIKRVEAGGHRTNPARRVQEWTIRKLKGTCMCQHLRVPNNFCMENEVSRGAPARIFVRAREGCSRPLSGGCSGAERKRDGLSMLIRKCCTKWYIIIVLRMHRDWRGAYARRTNRLDATRHGIAGIWAEASCPQCERNVFAIRGPGRPHGTESNLDLYICAFARSSRG